MARELRKDLAFNHASPYATPAWRRFMPIAVLIALCFLAYALGGQRYLSLAHLAASRNALEALVTAHPLAAPSIFALGYALAVAVSLPAASVLTIFAGLLFGWLEGGAIVAGAATAGATALFLAARSSFGAPLRARFGARAARLAAGFEADAFNYLLVLRLAPIFPFFLVNIAPAFFRVSLATYVITTFIGILPGTFVYAYLGTGLDSAIDAAAAAGREVSIADFVTPRLTLAFLLLAIVAGLPIVIRKLRASRRG